MKDKFRKITATKGLTYAIIMLVVPFGIPVLLVYEGYMNRKYLIKKIANGSNKD